jgi:hypothetical protein
MPQTKPRPRHERWVEQQADRIVNRMELRGLSLHLQHFWFGPRWHLSNGAHVDNEIAEAITKSPCIVGVGDGLFDTVPGQTWRYAGSDFHRSLRRKS